jgi:4a-hydroxytetrahydrobiopterin dehydratase
MKLSNAAVTQALASLPGWTQKNDAIVRVVKLSSFPDAIAFVTRLAFDAQQNDHHPDLTISYRTVTIAWSTHDEGGITDKDIEGARLTDERLKMVLATTNN